MTATQFIHGDEWCWQEKAFVLSFGRPRVVLSTSQWLGGFQSELKGIYNYDLKDGNGRCEIAEATYAQALKRIAEELGFDGNQATGMTTAVSIQDTVVECSCEAGLEVTAIVTAGIEQNGGCAGDPGSYIEENHGFVPLGGTINMILLLNANLPPGAMVQALTTMVEAKTVAVRELQLPSIYSAEIATGSGTDGAFVLADPHGELLRTDAGKHSLLGELIGKTVKKAVKKALICHTKPENLNMNDHGNRLGRLGINRKNFIAYLSLHHPEYSEEKANEHWRKAAKNPVCGVTAALFGCLCDNLRWGLISPEQALRRGVDLLSLDASLRVFTMSELWYEYLL